MFLHLGKNESVLNREIIGIFDIDMATVSADTRSLLSRMQEEKKVVSLGLDIPKSFVLTDNELYESVYLVKSSADTLARRTRAPQICSGEAEGR